MKTKVNLKLQGLNRLMTSPPVTAVVAREAKALAQRAGNDFEFVIAPHRWTARAYVRAANAEGARKQAGDAALERALGSR